MPKRGTVDEHLGGYFFIHIPKTAGTSFRRMLYAEFPGDDVYPTHDEIVEIGGLYPPQPELKHVDSARRAATNVLIGHYPINAGRLFFDTRPYEVLTFVRDPVARAISNLLHLQRHGAQFQQTEPHTIIDQAPHQLSNLQVRFLSGVQGALTDRHVDAAKENLRKMAFFGITERFADSIARARSDLGWALTEEIETNVRPPDSPELPDDVVARLRDANLMDVDLYEYACALFDGSAPSTKGSVSFAKEKGPMRTRSVAANRRQRFFERWIDPTSKGLILSPTSASPITAGPESAEHVVVTPEQINGWTWSLVGEEYDYVFAHGVLTLMPDPIGWIRGLSEALRPTGHAMVVLSDARFGGQPSRPLTSLGTLIDASRGQTNTVSAGATFDSAYYDRGSGAALPELCDEAESREGHVDIHMFSSDSFREFIDVTRQLGLHNLNLKRLFQRDDHPGEFIALVAPTERSRVT